MRPKFRPSSRSRKPSCRPGFTLGKGQRVEYLFDNDQYRGTGWLYLWPETAPEPIYASILSEDLIVLRAASEIMLENLSLEVARNRLLSIAGGNDNLVRNCTLRDAGRDGAEISGTNLGARRKGPV